MQTLPVRSSGRGRLRLKVGLTVEVEVGVVQLHLQFILASDHGHSMNSVASASLAHEKCRSKSDGFSLNNLVKVYISAQMGH